MAKMRAEGCAWITATPHERWTQEGADGVETVAYWFPADTATDRTVLLLHGHRADASLMGPLGDYYRQQGFNVLIPDLRGHGMSGSNYVGMGYVDQPDQIGWLNRIVDTVGENAQIVLHGISMGGSTALMLSDDPNLPSQVKAVIDDCGFSSVVDEFSYQVGLNHLPAWPAVQFGDQADRGVLVRGR